MPWGINWPGYEIPPISDLILSQSPAEYMVYICLDRKNLDPEQLICYDTFSVLLSRDININVGSWSKSAEFMVVDLESMGKPKQRRAIALCSTPFSLSFPAWWWHQSMSLPCWGNLPGHGNGHYWQLGLHRWALWGSSVASGWLCSFFCNWPAWAVSWCCRRLI